MTTEAGQPLSVLVVDDNRSAAEAIAMLLGREGHKVEVRFDGQTAIDVLSEHTFDLVLTDLKMEPIDGLQVVRAARACDPPIEVIVFSAFGSVENAVEAMRLGALDFLTKPVTADQLIRRVRDLHAQHDEEITIVGESETTRHMREQAQRLALVRSTVLITGETGVGRRHLARWLHAHGLDQDKPLVIARPNQPPSEAELNGAGTLLVPNVDDWTTEAQVLLLRTLEGLEAGQPPRVIATANPDIDVRVAKGEFPPELYFRLAVLVVHIAPLRERPKDLGPLLSHFVRLHGEAFGKTAVRPTDDQLDLLSTHGWPGNLREVANLAERAVVLGGSAFDMPVKPRSAAGTDIPQLSQGFNLSEHLEEIERTLLVRAIEQTSGDRPAMGKLLGLERNTLRYKLNKYGLLERT